MTSKYDNVRIGYAVEGSKLKKSCELLSASNIASQYCELYKTNLMINFSDTMSKWEANSLKHFIALE